jgi:hypothetical protein
MSLKTSNEVQIPIWREGNFQCRGLITYGITYLQSINYAQFYMETKVWRRKNGDVCWSEGIFRKPHIIIKQHKPELTELLQFIGFNQTGTFMPYLDNAVFAYQCWLGLHDNSSHNLTVQQKEEKQKQNFSVLQWLLVLEENEKLPVFDPKEIQQLTNWLELRKPLIQERFHKTMEKFSVKYISEAAITQV